MKNIKFSSGFTLIEIMIVVAIIGILASIAYPSYLESVRKTRRAEGRAELNQLISAQENYKARRGTYLAFAPNASNVPFKTHSGPVDKPSFFIGAEACPGQTEQDCIRLYGIPQYNEPKITRLQITTTGVKNCTGSDQTVCWK